MRLTVLAICVTATLLGACRREEAVPVHEPMKLGATAAHQLDEAR